MIEAVKESIFDFGDNIVNGDMRAWGTEIGTAFVASPGREESSIVGEDFESNHLQFFEDTDQDMEYFVIERLTDTFTEIREGGFTGDHIGRDTGVGSVSPTTVIIVQNGEDLVGIEATVEITEKIDKEDAGRVVAGGTERRITMGDQGADEREIDEGSDHPGEATSNRTIREDFDEPFFELVPGKQMGIGKRFRVGKQNFGIDLVEFCANMINGESFEGAHHKGSPGQECRLLPNLQKGFSHSSGLLLSTKFLPEVFPQGIDINILDGSMKKMVMPSFGGPFCFPQTEPVGGPVTSSLEALFFDEGFQKENGIVIDGKPVGRDPGGIEGQNLGSQAFDFDPGKNEEAGIVDH